MATPRIRVIPLGGLGEIGMNCMAIEVGRDIVLVDCGVTFPRTDMGVDTFHPDFTWLKHRQNDLRGVLITHGHEDHIGALPYLLRHFDVPVYGPAYALELARLRLDEHGFGANDVKLVPTRPRQSFSVGTMDVEPVRVTHSIADATALILRTPGGTILHTGDFKLDPTPGDEDVTDEARLREAGDEGVRLLLSDSTNINMHGHSGSEAIAARRLLELTQGFNGRVIVGMFASNAHRLRALGDVALASGRRIVLLGRSVQTHARLARDLHHLSWPSDLVARPEEIATLPRHQVLAIASGTQAERLAALSRLAARSHPHFELTRGDRVIFSSRIIPGKEPSVMDLVGNLLRLGVEVRTATTDPGVHVSGHAYRDEQAHMLDLVRPRSFIPVHGTLHHLHRHGELATERGVAEVIVIENGETAEFSPETELTKGAENVPVGMIPTWAGEAIPAQVLRDRETIARSGVALVTVVVDAQGRPAAPASVATRGVLDDEADGDVLRGAAREVVKALSTRGWSRARPTDEEVAELARLTARRALERAVGKKPVMVATVVRTKPR